MIPFIKNISNVILVAILLSCVDISCTTNFNHSNESLDPECVYISDEERWLQALTSPEFSGRKTGTGGCGIAADYIIAELEKMGYTPKVEEFTYRDSISMRNIMVEIQGDIDSTLIIGAHYDGAVNSYNYQAANDNASGVIALLSIAKNIQPCHYNVLLCLWDGEETTEGKSFNGSSYFVKHTYKEKLDYIKWYCNIDCCGREGDSTYLYYSEDLQPMFEDLSIDDVEPLNLIMKVQRNNGSDYVAFKAKGIPFWGWNDLDIFRYIHTPEDTAECISLTKIKTISSLTILIING